MNTRNTLLLLVAAGALYGLTRVYDHYRPGNRVAAFREEYVLEFEPAGIDAITLHNDDGKIEFKRSGTLWEMTKPVHDRANQALIGELLGRTRMLRKEAALDPKEVDKKALKNFGVAKSKLRLEFEGRNAPPELLFGKETAVDGKVYLRLDGSDHVYIIEEALKELVSRKADEYRDRQIAEMDGAHVHRVVLKSAAGEMELVRESDLWQLRKPLQTRAEERAAIDLVGSILNTEIVGFAEEKGANLNTYGLNEPRATVSLWSSNREEPLTIEIGAHDPKAKATYARISTRGTVCLLPERVEQLLALRPNNLRSQHLVRPVYDIIDRITIAGKGEPFVLKRNREEWSLAAPATPAAPPKAIDAANVRRMVDALEKRPIVAFVADVAPDLAPYGLDKPQRRVTLSSYSSETTAEGAAGEYPIATLLFGEIEGNTVYAKLEDEPFVYSVNKTILHLIPGEATEWLEMKPFNFTDEALNAIHRVEIMLGGVTRDYTLKEGVWTAPPRGAENDAPAVPLAEEAATRLQSLVNTLSKLTPMRRAAESVEPDPGAKDRPSRIAIETAGGNRVEFLIGPPAEDGTLPVSLQGDPGSLILSAPDASVFLAPVD